MSHPFWLSDIYLPGQFFLSVMVFHSIVVVMCGWGVFAVRPTHPYAYILRVNWQLSSQALYGCAVVVEDGDEGSAVVTGGDGSDEGGGRGSRDRSRCR